MRYFMHSLNAQLQTRLNCYSSFQNPFGWNVLNENGEQADRRKIFTIATKCQTQLRPWELLIFKFTSNITVVFHEFVWMPAGPITTTVGVFAAKLSYTTPPITTGINYTQFYGSRKNWLRAWIDEDTRYSCLASAVINK